MLRTPLLTALIAFSVLLPAAEARMTDASRVSRRSIRAEVRQQSANRALRYRGANLNRTYENAQFGVSLKYPGTWNLSEPLDTEGELTLVMMLLSPKQSAMDLRENINLVVEEVDQTMTLATYTREGLAKEKLVFDDFRLLSSVPTTVGGHAGQRVHFLATFGNLKMAYTQAWFLKNGKAYVWTFADSEEHFPKDVATFEAMMETLVMK